MVASIASPNTGDVLTPFSPTPDQLHAALEDIAYEIEQLIGICSRLIRFRDPAQTVASDTADAFLDENVYIECFLVHVRVLLDFLEKPTRSVVKGRELDDVLAQDYGFAAQPVVIQAGLRKRINQEIAHLSYSRTQRKGDSKNWFPAAIARPLLLRCEEFASHIGGMPEPLVTSGVQMEFAAIQHMIGHLLRHDPA